MLNEYIQKNDTITFFIHRYAIEVSPTIKGLIGFLQEKGYKINILTDHLYRNSSFSMKGVNIFILDAGLKYENYNSILNESAYIFAVEFPSLSNLSKIKHDLSNVVYLSLESTQFILNENKQTVLNLLNYCKFGVIQSTERQNDFLKYFDGNLELQFEHLPVSIRPVKKTNEKSEGKIIYSGYFSEWSGMREFLELFDRSRYGSFFDLTIQGHSMGTEDYEAELQKKITGYSNINIDGNYYNDEQHIKLLCGKNIGIAIYKKMDSSANWDNLLFSSGKIANYLWCGCAVITNIQHELTSKPPFIFIKDLNDSAGLDIGLNSYLDNTDLYIRESIKLANIYYNLDRYASKILERLCKKSNDQLYQKKREDIYSTDLHSLFLKNDSSLKNEPLKLHLGCGENYLEGYVNIDFPTANHNVMKVKADKYADITKLEYPAESIDEIRLHHVLEHFNRVVSTGLLIKWQKWLKIGGILRIETPDFEECAKKLVNSGSDYRTKFALLRHLEGDQAESWAYHITQWTKDRFIFALQQFGFEDLNFHQTSWQNKPYLANIEVTAKKQKTMSDEELFEKAKIILYTGTVADNEVDTFNVWVNQLKSFLNEKKYVQTNIRLKHTPVVSLDQIHDFNQIQRDAWINEKALKINKGSKVLDVGAGTCPYKNLFVHCEYYSQDFKKYPGEKLGGTEKYGDIDIASDILSIPAEDGFFDVILCTEVLEHVPEPIKAIKEMVRLLKKGGKILITAPLGSGLHQLPFHYYGGYTPEWYKKFLPENGIIVKEIKPNGGFFKHLAQECARAASVLKEKDFNGIGKDDLFRLLNENLPEFFYSIDDENFIENFTVGYLIEGQKL